MAETKTANDGLCYSEGDNDNDHDHGRTSDTNKSALWSAKLTTNQGCVKEEYQIIVVLWYPFDGWAIDG